MGRFIKQPNKDENEQNEMNLQVSLGNGDDIWDFSTGTNNVFQCSSKLLAEFVNWYLCPWIYVFN